MKMSVAGFVILIICFISFFFSISRSAGDTLNATQSLKDGDTIVSAEGSFEMGFFPPGKSEKRYVGIWYNKIATGTVVWVANRDIPLNDSSGVLKFSGQGDLVLVNGTNNIIWSSRLSRSATNPVARLLDTGNLVVGDVNGDDPENLLWQSFDYPGNTFLAGMKGGIDLRTGLERVLTSWKSPDDPSVGEYSNRLHPGGVPQILLWKGSVLRFRSGPWNGLWFSGMPNLKPNQIYTSEFVFNDTEIYYKYELINSSVVARIELTPDGALQGYIWVHRTQEWNLYIGASMDDCNRYALCGAHGSCNINNSPACGCLKGFIPKLPEEWAAADWSNGCVRKVSLDCREGEDFLKYSGIKLPDTRQSWYNKTMKLEECKRVCLKNCSCTAYANMDIRGGGSGCILWFNDLIDIRQYNENGQDIYIRLAASEIAAYRSSKGKERVRKIIILVLSFAIVLLGLFLIFVILKRRKKFRRKGAVVLNRGQEVPEERETDDLELPLFDFATLTDATGYFLMSNMLGQGGFGSVYKAWRLFNEESFIELIDESVKDSCNIAEVLRSVHVGLLCVQQSPEDRPSMSTVVLMLSSDIILPQPKKPGFYAERSLIGGDSSTGKQDTSSTNEVTVTLLEPR
ncbi:hypothetical protein Pint_04367 [Pistacia integerrima]|uniref:Uncharacterized protein n=1 Tax=Pistacia integerrima TaxID=434235 RepID=A0ACC0Z4T4_9ROSI|nr:hypothetical protein Pint_04367 [Pistacia integerrima]